MKYDLPRLIAQRTKRRQFTFGTPDPLKRDQDALLRIYLRVIRHWEGARGRLVEAYGRELENAPYMDHKAPLGTVYDTIDDLQAEIDREAGWFQSVFLSLEVQITAWTGSIEAWHRSKWRGSILSASGVDVDTMLYAGDVQQTVLASIRGQLELIRDVNDQQRARMAEAIFRGLNQRMPAREVAKELQAITAFGRKRSLLIASVELQKIATALDRERQAEAGLKSFKWFHSKKKHPRNWHVARNGKIYDWKTRKQVGGDEVIPADDMAGIPIRCGCRAAGYLEIEGVDDDGNPI